MLVVAKPNRSPSCVRHSEWLKKACIEKNITPVWYFTQGNFCNDVSQIRELAKCHNDVVVIGGDGSINLVVNAIVGLPCRLALLPAGTGNDFARQFSHSDKQWQQAVFSEQTLTVDIGKVNDRYFINMAGIGFSAAVVKDMDTFNKRGKLSYVMAGIKKIFSFRGVTLDDAPRHLMVLFANGQFFAAGLKAAPSANMQSGSLRVLHFNAQNLCQRLWCFILMFAALHEKSRFVSGKDISEFEIKQADLPLEADGDLVGVTPAIIKCCAAAITLKV